MAELQLKSLSFDTLAQLRGGLIEKALVNQIDRQVQDLYSAPDIATARKVTLEIDLIPHCESGELVDVAVQFKIKGRSPAREMVAHGIVRAHGRLGRQTLLFNVDDPDNPDQLPLPLSDDDDSAS